MTSHYLFLLDVYPLENFMLQQRPLTPINEPVNHGILIFSFWTHSIWLIWIHWTLKIPLALVWSIWVRFEYYNPGRFLWAENSFDLLFCRLHRCAKYCCSSRWYWLIVLETIQDSFPLIHDQFGEFLWRVWLTLWNYLLITFEVLRIKHRYNKLMVNSISKVYSLK